MPFHKVQATIALGYKTFTLKYNQIYNGKVFTTRDNSVYLPHFAPANISITNKIKLNNNNTLVLQFALNNLFNEDYHIIANRPMPRQNYEFSLVYDFNKK